MLPRKISENEETYLEFFHLCQCFHFLWFSRRPFEISLTSNDFRVDLVKFRVLHIMSSFVRPKRGHRRRGFEIFTWIKAYIRFVEPEGRKSSALYQNPEAMCFQRFLDVKWKTFSLLECDVFNWIKAYIRFVEPVMIDPWGLAKIYLTWRPDASARYPFVSFARMLLDAWSVDPLIEG